MRRKWARTPKQTTIGYEKKGKSPNRQPGIKKGKRKKRKRRKWAMNYKTSNGQKDKALSTRRMGLGPNKTM
jgi:hypothetical protein